LNNIDSIQQTTRMDIRKLQRIIVNALEDVKAQDIQVFNTEALTSLFDRVIVASGTSNRQTRGLAASVRDAVKQAGGEVRAPEGDGSGEWVLVDCGDAVVHIMQPVIRAYYKLEDIWGGKSVHLKPLVPVSTTAERQRAAAAAPAATKAASRSGAPKPPAAATRPGAAAAAAKSPARKTASTATNSAAVKSAASKPAARKPAASKSAATKPAAAKPATRKSAAPAAAPAKKAAARKTAKPRSDA
jgi:ribosome-associated protein